MERLERNKETVKAFYDLMFNQNNPRTAVEQYVGADYVQHNPHVADGKEAFIVYFEHIHLFEDLAANVLFEEIRKVALISRRPFRCRSISLQNS